MLTKKQVAQMIDISAVRTQHGLADIQEVVAYAKQYHFINVHVLPNWVSTLVPMLADVDDVYAGAPVGFPSGAHRTEVKVLEAELLLQDGVQEMDIVMNVGRFKNGEYQYVRDELQKIVGIAKGKALTKVLIELNCLDDRELDAACDLVAESGADFLKTGTGWVPGGPNVERIAQIKKRLPSSVKVKAAGGIRTKDDFMRLYDLGVERFGINTASAMEIVSCFE